MLTDLTNPSGFVIAPPRSRSNSCIDFLNFVIFLIDSHALVAGDIFIVDNASIHNASLIEIPLALLLDRYRIRIAFLPSYSPELNPCELIFCQMKTHLRKRIGDDLLWIDMIYALNCVSYENVLSYYRKCIF